MAQGKLHDLLIQRACDTDGWTRLTRKTPWREPFVTACRDNDEWWGEIAGGIDEETGEFVESELTTVFRSFSVLPDAWRLRHETPETPNTSRWGYDVLVLEFLEVEVDHGITDAKLNAYLDLWWAFDASSSFCMRVFHMDRFGIVRPYLTEDTIMDAYGAGGPYHGFFAEQPLHAPAWALLCRS